MADLFKLNAIDKEKIDKGVWHPIQGDCEFLLSSMINNEDYEKAGRKIAKKYRKQFRTKEISTVAQYKIIAEAIADCIVLDWKNLEWKGKKLKYSKENALMILQDNKAGRSLVDMIVACASSKDDYLEDFEDDVKN